MPVYKGTGRKQTGRTDQFSDETPKKDYDDYRKKHPNDSKAPRNTKKENPTKHVGPKTIKVKKQELISKVQEYRETFNPVELNNWQQDMERLKYELERV